MIEKDKRESVRLNINEMNLMKVDTPEELLGQHTHALKVYEDEDPVTKSKHFLFYIIQHQCIRRNHKYHVHLIDLLYCNSSPCRNFKVGTL